MDPFGAICWQWDGLFQGASKAIGLTLRYVNGGDMANQAFGAGAMDGLHIWPAADQLAWLIARTFKEDVLRGSLSGAVKGLLLGVE